MPFELPASLAQQLPVAALFVSCAALAGRYAARLVDRLVAGQERAQRQFVEALERNTAAWRDTCAALDRLEAAVIGRSRRNSGRPSLERDLRRGVAPTLDDQEWSQPAHPRKEVDIP